MLKRIAVLQTLPAITAVFLTVNGNENMTEKGVSKYVLIKPIRTLLIIINDNDCKRLC
jgi:hypothetical protein